MKYAVVTGSTSGIGYAVAKALISDGYFVFLNGRKRLSADLPGESYMFVKADVSVPHGVDTLAEAVLSRTDSIDSLVLNAGATCRKSMEYISYDDWQKVMDTNVNMPFLLVQRLMPNICRGGNVLFIGSAMGVKPHSSSLPYGVSKAAVISLAQNLVKEMPGIRVNCICPGFVDTDWQQQKPEWLKEKISSKIALKRFADPDEIADMCIKIMSNTYMNGAVVNVDGGYDME